MSDFDFGFNAVSLDELNFFQEQKETIEATTQEAQQASSKLAELRNAIQPLLNNLKRDADKDYSAVARPCTKDRAVRSTPR